MFSRLTKALYSIIAKLLESLRSFPESLILITATVYLIIDDNHNGFISTRMGKDFSRLTMIFLMGFLLFLCYRVLKENIFSRRAICLAIWAVFIGFLVFYYFVLLQDLKTIPVVRYIAVLFILFTAFLFIPYIKRSKGFELYIINIIISLMITYLYAGVLFLGLISMVFTVDQLFNLKFSGKLYLDIWFITAGIFAPAYFLGGLQKGNSEADENSYSKVLKVLFLYIVMPIISVYTVILYAYFAKILITQQWPKGLVSNLVLWYSFITAAIIFLIKPLTDKNMWAYRFSKVLPVVIIPLIFMCFWAMGIRIHSYGVTESRYYVIVGAIWVLLVFVYWIIRGWSRNVVIPVSLAVVALLTIAGPQSAFSVSFNSQAGRLSSIFSNYNMLQNGKLSKGNQQISAQDRKEISSILQYLNNTHGVKKLDLLPADFSLNNAEEYFGFDVNESGPIVSRQYFSFSGKSTVLVDISGYRYYTNIRSYDSAHSNSKDLSVDFDSQSGVVTVSQQNRTVYRKNILDFISQLPESQGKNSQLDSDKLTFRDSSNGIDVMLVFSNVAYEVDEYGVKTINNAEFSLFIK